MTVTYTTLVIGDGNHASLHIPDSVLAELGANRRAPLKVTINGHTYRSTATGVGGECRVVFPSRDRAVAGVKSGDIVTVTLELETGHREVIIPEELAAALQESGFRDVFESMPYSHRKEYVRWVEGLLGLGGAEPHRWSGDDHFSVEVMESPQELEAVLAHELGHFRHRHVAQRLVLLLALSLLGLALLGAASQWSGFYLGLGVQPNLMAPNDGLALALFALALPPALFLLSPLAVWWSRRQEFEADAFAASQADAPALASALVKLYTDNAATLTPDPWVVRFQYSHPPALQRLQAGLEDPAPPPVERLALVGSNADGAGQQQRRRRQEQQRLLRRRGTAALARAAKGSYFAGRPARWQARLVLDMARRTTPTTARKQMLLAAQRGDTLQTLATFAGPVAVLSGLDDQLCTPVQQQRMKAARRDALAQAWDRCGHMIPLEAPGRLALAVQHWLAQTPRLTPISSGVSTR